MVKQTAYCCTSSLFVYVLTQKLCLQCRYSARVDNSLGSDKSL